MGAPTRPEVVTTVDGRRWRIYRDTAGRHWRVDVWRTDTRDPDRHRWWPYAKPRTRAAALSIVNSAGGPTESSQPELFG